MDNFGPCPTLAERAAAVAAGTIDAGEPLNGFTMEESVQAYLGRDGIDLRTPSLTQGA